MHAQNWLLVAIDLAGSHGQNVDFFFPRLLPGVMEYFLSTYLINILLSWNRREIPGSISEAVTTTTEPHELLQISAVV